MSGIHMTLLIGPGFPIPAPAAVLNALESVQVTSGTDRGGFQLSFKVGKADKLLTTMLPAGYLDPIITRVILVATVRGVPHVLADGVVTRHELASSNEPGASTLTVTGEDLSVLMDLVEMPFMRFPGMNELAQVNTILAKYAAFGVVPVVVPPVISLVPAPTEKIPTQTGTDLAYIRQLAQRCGYIFCLEPGPAPGTSIAYFGPDVRVPVPQPALSINMDAHSNVDSLSFSLDGRAKKIVVITVLDPITKKITIPIPVPNLNILKPPLGARLTPPARVEFPEGMAALDPGEAAKRALGISISAADAITGTGSLDVSRYGHVLRSRMLVGIRGAGLAYDGMYYVNNVTHTLKRGEYKQSFNLSRDGLIATSPMVPT
jgi:hypothetical protein